MGHHHIKAQPPQKRRPSTATTRFGGVAPSRMVMKVMIPTMAMAMNVANHFTQWYARV
jgi:hypothetical protein